MGSLFVGWILCLAAAWCFGFIDLLIWLVVSVAWYSVDSTVLWFACFWTAFDADLLVVGLLGFWFYGSWCALITVGDFGVMTGLSVGCCFRLALDGRFSCGFVVFLAGGDCVVLVGVDCAVLVGG